MSRSIDVRCKCGNAKRIGRCDKDDAGAWQIEPGPGVWGLRYPGVAETVISYRGPAQSHLVGRGVSLPCPSCERWHDITVAVLEGAWRNPRTRFILLVAWCSTY